MQRSGIDTIKHHTWPRIPMGKWQRHNKTSQTRAKRSALSQQLTTMHQQTDVHESITKQDRNNINNPHKKHRLGTVSKNTLLEGSNRFFQTNYRLIQVKSIAECSKRGILQYFRPSLSYHLSLRSSFCLFWGTVIHRFYCTIKFLTVLTC